MTQYNAEYRIISVGFGRTYSQFEFGIERIPNCLSRIGILAYALAIGPCVFAFRTPALYSNLENRDYYRIEHRVISFERYLF